MNPIFSLPYSEYCVAESLLKHFKPKNGYSVYIPLSRQEKGVDILLCRKMPKGMKVATIQIKSSRTYTRTPPKRSGVSWFKYYTWFNRFEIQKETNFYFLFGIFPDHHGLTRKNTISRWTNIILVFSMKEMKNFMNNVKTRTGKADNMFGFGFDGPKNIIQTRGDKEKNYRDYTKYLLINRLNVLKRHFHE